MDQRTGCERNQGQVALLGATPSDQVVVVQSEEEIHPIPHCQENRGIVVFGLERRTSRVLESYVAMLGDGPKRSVNRGAGGCVKFLVGRLNQTVSIHADKANAPTHHSPGNHGFPLKVQKHAHQTSPRRTKSDPSRAGLDHSRY